MAASRGRALQDHAGSGDDPFEDGEHERKFDGITRHGFLGSSR
jgi:hypothetical protein